MVHVDTDEGGLVAKLVADAVVVGAAGCMALEGNQWAFVTGRERGQKEQAIPAAIEIRSSRNENAASATQEGSPCRQYRALGWRRWPVGVVKARQKAGVARSVLCGQILAEIRVCFQRSITLGSVECHLLVGVRSD